MVNNTILLDEFHMQSVSTFCYKKYRVRTSNDVFLSQF